MRGDLETKRKYEVVINTTFYDPEVFKPNTRYGLWFWEQKDDTERDKFFTGGQFSLKAPVDCKGVKEEVDALDVESKEIALDGNKKSRKAKVEYSQDGTTITVHLETSSKVPSIGCILRNKDLKPNGEWIKYTNGGLDVTARYLGKTTKFFMLPFTPGIYYVEHDMSKMPKIEIKGNPGQKIRLKARDVADFSEETSFNELGVIMIFPSERTTELLQIIREVDETTGKTKDIKVGPFKIESDKDNLFKCENGMIKPTTLESFKRRDYKEFKINR